MFTLKENYPKVGIMMFFFPLTLVKPMFLYKASYILFVRCFQKKIKLFAKAFRKNKIFLLYISLQHSSFQCTDFN